MNKDMILRELLTETLAELENIKHGPACSTWSGRNTDKCDCSWPGLIRRIRKALKNTSSARA